MGPYSSLLPLYAAQVSRETEPENEAEKFLLPRDVIVRTMTSGAVHYSRVYGDAQLCTVHSPQS